MAKRAVSVTLEADNLLWLRGQARAASARSLSQILDRLVSDARRAGRVHESSVRSVVGTIRIADDDEELLRADAAIRALFPVPRQPALGARTLRPKRATGRRFSRVGRLNGRRRRH